MGVRQNVHRQNVTAGQTSPFVCYLRALLSERRWPLFRVIERCPASHLQDAEACWIAHFRSGGHGLMNVTSGGTDNPMHHPGVVEKVRAKLKGRKVSPAHVAKNGLAKRGNRYRLGAVASEETRARLRQISRNLWSSPEYREKVSAAQKRVWEDENHRKMMSDAHRGKPLSAEHRQAIAAAQSGKTRGPYRKRGPS
jgi:hypothetical protein